MKRKYKLEFKSLDLTTLCMFNQLNFHLDCTVFYHDCYIILCSCDKSIKTIKKNLKSTSRFRLIKM